MSNICSITSRCKSFKLVYIDSDIICLSCNTIFKKGKKILIKCCKKQIINHHTNLPYCVNCCRFLYS